jgi:dihydroxyacid dehydratase/phosphogluconate dehydratase
MARPAFVVELQEHLGLRREARSDSITIDAGRFLIQLNVSDAELAKRRQAWTPRAPDYTRGVLAKYAKLASSASKGGGDRQSAASPRWDRCQAAERA